MTALINKIEANLEAAAVKYQAGEITGGEMYHKAWDGLTDVADFDAALNHMVFKYVEARHGQITECVIDYSWVVEAESKMRDFEIAAREEMMAGIELPEGIHKLTPRGARKYGFQAEFSAFKEKLAQYADELNAEYAAEIERVRIRNEALAEAAIEDLKMVSARMDRQKAVQDFIDGPQVVLADVKEYLDEQYALSADNRYYDEMWNRLAEKYGLSQGTPAMGIPVLWTQNYPEDCVADEVTDYIEALVGGRDNCRVA